MEDKYIKMSKCEIATYLRNYMELMISAANDRTTSFAELFCQNMEYFDMTRYANYQYYHNMTLVYDFFLLVNYYGIINDLEETNLEEEKIENICNFKNIFVNSEDSNKFSKKKIIKYIRNALCHNDKSDRELYQLYRCNDELFIEILLKKTKPIPFHIRLNLCDYINIMSQLQNSNHSTEFTVLLPLKINKQNYSKYLDDISLVYIDLIDKVTDKDNGICIISETSLKEEQKLKIMQSLPNFYINNKKHFKDLLTYVVLSTIPLGGIKLDDILYNLTILQPNIKEPTNSVFQTIKNIETLNNKETDFKQIINYNHFEKYTYFSFIVFFRYMIDSIINNDEININNTIYPRNKIRNSLVHGRWFFGPNDSLDLYDYENSNEYRYGSNWHESIPCENLISFVQEEYIKLVNNEKNHIINELDIKQTKNKEKTKTYNKMN